MLVFKMWILKFIQKLLGLMVTQDNETINEDSATFSENVEPKVYALHIGINNYDSISYGQEIQQLQSCNHDALDLQALFGNVGEAYVDSEAVSDLFTQRIGALATKAKAGDTVIITQSSHGTRFQDEGGDEVDGFDEGTCFYDRIMWDDEIKNVLSFFKPGVNLITIWDTCHSGTGTRAPGIGTKFLNKDANIEQSNLRKFWEKKQSYDRDIKCNSLHLAAAQDNEYALDGESNGNFTGTLISVIKRRHNIGLSMSIADIMEEVKGVIVGQHPNIDVVTTGGESILKTEFPLGESYV